MNDYMVTGMVTYWCLIFISNIKVCILTNTFNAIYIFILIGSPSLFPIFYWYYSSHSAFDVYGYFQKTISLSFFLALMVTIGVNSVFDFGIWKFKSTINLLLLYDF